MREKYSDSLQKNGLGRNLLRSRSKLFLVSVETLSVTVETFSVNFFGVLVVIFFGLCSKFSQSRLTLSSDLFKNFVASCRIVTK